MREQPWSWMLLVVSLLSWKFDFGLNKISYVTINQLEFKVTWSTSFKNDRIRNSRAENFL